VKPLHGLTLLAAVLLGTAALAGCSDSADDPGDDSDSDRIVLTPAEDGEGHTHAPGQGHSADGPVGDGSAPRAGGYRLDDVVLPREPGDPGELSFRILDGSGEPVLDYVEEQTKLLHLYVVRDDLADFRHLHPSLADDGTWTTQVDVATPGEYRVIAEFHPEGSERAVILGQETTVPGGWEEQAVPTGAEAAAADDGVVTVTVDGAAETGDDGRMTMRVTNADGEPVTLGNYLGTFAHVTGFGVETGRFVHTHPYGAPEQTEEGTELTFHTTFTEPGDYRLFVQVRVEGFVHQVPVTATVTDGG
jgi:hypothetical protein